MIKETLQETEQETLKNHFTDEDLLFWHELESEEHKRKYKFKNSPTLQQKKYEEFLRDVIVNLIEAGTILESTYEGLFGGLHRFSHPGTKDDIYVENRPSENKFLKNTQIGDKVELIITSIGKTDYFVKGSLSQLYENQAHDELVNLDKAIVEIDVRSINPAGYDVDVLYNGVTLSGFMPNTLAGINKLYNPESLVGTRMTVMVESFSKNEGTYIVSRRKYLQTLIPEAIENLTIGQVYQGNVTGTTPFGVFVEFNECLTGMIHKANITEEYRDKITQIQPGTEIVFYVKEVIKNKIILTQYLRESLWDTIRVGSNIRGVVRDTKSFGVLISLDDETTGLIHSNEVEKIKRKFTPGEEINTKVLAVDKQNRKIFLTVDM